jgi:hypothetical protein
VSGVLRIDKRRDSADDPWPLCLFVIGAVDARWILVRQKGRFSFFARLHYLTSNLRTARPRATDH